MKSVLYLSMLIISVLSIDFANAQSTLTNGDIIFTGYNGVPPNGTPDTFTFVVVSPILPGTTIYFTERGYQGGATWQTAGTTEGTVSWMTSTLISVGDNVLIAGLGGSAAMVNGVPNGMVTQVLGGNPISGLSLSDAGDQVIAFQGGGGDPTIAVNFIAGISWMLNCGTTSVASWNASGCSYGPQTSLMPPGLIGGFSAYLAGVAGTNPNANKGKFNCFGTPYSNVSAMRSAIMSTSNWVYNFPPATGAVPLSVSCNNYASCTNPNIISSSGNTFACVNGNASFSINATGATGYQWQVNQGSGFNNIVNGAPYSGATSNMLGITGATASMNGYLYRCIASNGACTSTSTQAQLSVDNTQLSNITTNISCNGMANG
ncbi:MAG TPA: immunoglobulin domain-containing protein, partial [Saprospiraceae bacterium]|nr:immunoglobulin domain-containing protein [Saprospiraceae bacterium]